MKCCNHNCNQGRDCPNHPAREEDPYTGVLYACALALIAVAIIIGIGG